MKKSLLLGIAGLAIAGSAFGQGTIYLDNYAQNSGLINAGVKYGAGVPANGVSGALGTVGAGLSSAWTVGLYFVTGTPSINDPAGNGIPASPLNLGTGGGSTTQVANAAAGGTPGAFFASGVFNTGLAVGTTITMELVAYNTSAGSYANALYRGHTAPFTITTVLGTAVPPAYTPASFGTFSVTSVAPVPEPSTLALAGLGGFGMLMAMRRKQA